jgi:hypothetical protein
MRVQIWGMPELNSFRPGARSNIVSYLFDEKRICSTAAVCSKRVVKQGQKEKHIQKIQQFPYLTKIIEIAKDSCINPKQHMKNIAILFALCFCGTQANALQYYEGFSYPPASALGGQGGWVLSSGANPVIQAGTLVTTGLMPAGEGNSVAFGGAAMEVRHALTNLVDGEPGGNYFYSLTFKVTALGSMTTNGGFVAAFSRSVQTIAYGGLLYLRKDVLGAANSYNIGIAKTSALDGDVTWDTGGYLVGQTNFVVCKYSTPDQGDTSTYLWINPDPSTYGVADGSRPAPTLTATAGSDPLLGVGQIVLHQSSATAGPGGIVLDQIRVEGSWPNVTPVPLTMTAAITSGTNFFMSWGGNQNVLLQETANLTPPVTWTSLNGGLFGDGSVKNWTITNVSSAPSPKFFRLHAWHAE